LVRGGNMPLRQVSKAKNNPVENQMKAVQLKFLIVE
jgi:hypothetical protein